MPARRRIPPEIQERVRQRAKSLCEYCHTSEQWQYVRFTVDHIIPLTQDDINTLDNLALACFHCNRRKSNKVIAPDPVTEEMVSLFNPRQHYWSEHFIWSADGLIIIGLTPIGRATVELLTLNRDRIIHIRAADVVVGRHPPPDDPIQRTNHPVNFSS
jgi:hypothetical protein